MRVVLLTGKGGVGKTSHAAATALGAAAHGHRVFLLSTDPAHSLGDALGQRVGARAVPVEARVLPSEISGPEDPYAWTTFEGRWGARLSGEFNGPTGPNDKRAWDRPFAWQEDLRETSVEVPISRNLDVGINVADMFCGVVSFASNNLLVAFMSSPWIL